MNEHIVLQILKDLDVNSENDVEKRLTELDIQSIGLLLDKMESWYKLQSAGFSGKKSENSIFDTWIPTTPKDGIYSISSNLLLADTVTISDPLYDTFSLLESDAYGINIAMSLGNESKHICSSCLGQLSSMTNDILKSRLANILVFYQRSKPLLESGQLIPYIDLTPKHHSELASPMVELLRKYDDEFRTTSGYFDQIQEQVRTKMGKNHLFDIPESDIHQYVEVGIQKSIALLGVVDVFTVKNIPASSIDFLGDVSASALKALLKYIQKNSKQEITSDFLMPDEQHHFELPTLAGIPMQDVPEILYKEKDSFDQLKSSINLKIAKLSAPYATAEWQAQINSIRAEMQHDLLELNRTLTHLQTDHLQRQAMNISLLAFSVSIASLALLNQTINPVSAIQTVAGGAGMASSLKGIIETWLDYRKDVYEQKRKDLYFLWVLRNRSNH
jgi:hypothetical protein